MVIWGLLWGMFLGALLARGGGDSRTFILGGLMLGALMGWTLQLVVRAMVRKEWAALHEAGRERGGGRNGRACRAFRARSARCIFSGACRVWRHGHAAGGRAACASGCGGLARAYAAATAGAAGAASAAGFP